MMQPWEIIQQLESNSSRLHKEQVIAAASDSDCHEFFHGLRLALDSLITFGVKQVPLSDDNSRVPPGLMWFEFYELAERLRTRQITGYAAQHAIEQAQKKASVTQWNDWYRRILIKDLRCGVSEKTVNKVVPGTIPVFTCALAHDSSKHENKMVGQKQVEIKLDGVRVLTVVQGQKVEMFSRNGKQFHNFGHIIEEIQSVIAQHPAPYPLVLDGEIMSANFQDLMKQVHRKDNVAANDAVLYLFDTIPLSSFQDGKWDKPQSFRSEITKHWVEQHSDMLPHVRALDWELVDLDTEAGKQKFLEINENALAGGYEGLLIKDPNAPYECKRTHAWLKAKPVISVDLQVVELQAGTGRNTGFLGALICEGVDQGRHIRVHVGSGLTDQQRKEFWDNKELVIGATVEVFADAVTQSQDQEDIYSLRFPRFHRFRDDK